MPTRRSPRFLFAALVVMALGPQTSHPVEPLALDAPRLSGITVDGDSSDWGQAGLRVDILTPNRPVRPPLASFDATVALGWDEPGMKAQAADYKNSLRLNFPGGVERAGSP